MKNPPRKITNILPVLIGIILILSALTAISQYLVRGRISLASPESETTKAEKAFIEGERLIGEWKADSLRLAIEKYEEASSYWQRAGNKLQESIALRKTGHTQHLSGEYGKAIDSFSNALSLSRGINDQAGECETLSRIGHSYLLSGKTEKALESCNQSLTLSRATGNKQAEALALNNLGDVYYNTGEIPKAIALLQQAFSLSGSLNDVYGQALALHRLGYSYSDLSENEKALSSYQQSLHLWQSLNKRREEALTQSYLGDLYSKLGDKQKALEYFAPAGKLFELLDDKFGYASVLNGRAYVYDELGNKQRALDCRLQALHLFQSVNEKFVAAFTLGLIGDLYYSLNDYQKSSEYAEQSLSLARTLGNQRLEAYMLGELGKIKAATGKPQESLKLYHSSLPLIREVKDPRQEAHTLNDLGRAYEQLNQKQKANECYRKALPLNRSTRDRFGESQTLYNLARIKSEDGRFDQARSDLAAAAGIVEKLRYNVINQELRTSYFSSVHDVYALYTDVLMRLHRQRPRAGFASEALAVSERARVRTLLDQLAEAHARIREGVDPELLSQERMLLASLNGKAERKMTLINSKASREEIATLGKEIDDLAFQHHELQAKLKVSSPRYVTLTQPQPLTTRQIQQQLLDDQTVLLEYSLGEQRSYVWVVGRNSLASYELPARRELEETARTVYGLLSRRAVKDGKVALSDASRLYWQEAAKLSQMIIAPVAKEIAGKRLLVVTEGALQYVPLAALPIPDSTPKNKLVPGTTEISRSEPEPMLTAHEIIPLPSASLLAVLRKETSGRNPAPRSVAILADPVFGKDDERVKANAGKTNSKVLSFFSRFRGAGEKSRNNDGESEPNFSRLPGTRREAEAIMRLLQPGSGLLATGFDVNRQLTEGETLKQYRYVHFATHGFLDNERPELSGIVLSLVDPQGNKQNGFLRMEDIFNLRLNAEMVVLSACQTAEGKDVKGEGLVALTRGLMYAGAERVTASLWKVDDDFAAELMQDFYERVIHQGKSPAAALRESQLAMRNKRIWREPFHWAAFIMQGEYR